MNKEKKYEDNSSKKQKKKQVLTIEKFYITLNFDGDTNSMSKNEIDNESAENSEIICTNNNNANNSEGIHNEILPNPINKNNILNNNDYTISNDNLIEVGNRVRNIIYIIDNFILVKSILMGNNFIVEYHQKRKEIEDNYKKRRKELDDNYERQINELDNIFAERMKDLMDSKDNLVNCLNKLEIQIKKIKLAFSKNLNIPQNKNSAGQPNNVNSKNGMECPMEVEQKEEKK